MQQATCILQNAACKMQPATGAGPEKAAASSGGFLSTAMAEIRAVLSSEPVRRNRGI
jgi:hypothetical protein